MKNTLAPWFAAGLLALSVGAACAQSESADTVDNGTDPTKLTRFALVTWEHLALNTPRDNVSRNFSLRYATPIDRAARTNVVVRLPFISTDLAGNSGYGIGDVLLRANHIYRLTRTDGIVLTGELGFNTADGVDRGLGKNVVRLGGTYALFLAHGIFAPTVLHAQSLGVGADSGRARVSNTTFDFYYVPKLPTSRYFVTIDPALVQDWETNKMYGALSVTVGAQVGKLWGGNAIARVKPQVGIGGNRLATWGIEFGFQLLGF